MKKFFSFVIKQSVAIVLCVLLVMGCGVLSTMNMSINLLPDINVPVVCVQAIYAGAGASSVERDVTIKIEDGLSNTKGVKKVESYSYDNLSAVILSFSYGTDIAKSKADISAKLPSLNLPDGVEVSVSDVDLNSTALATLSVTSEKGLDEAYARATELANEINGVDGVEKTQVKGGAEYTYSVIPYAGLELSCPLIVQSFSQGALSIPLGSITTDSGEVQIRNNTAIKSVEDISNSPLELPQEFLSSFAQYKTLLSSLAPQLGVPPYSDEKLALISNVMGVRASNELIALILNTPNPIKVKDIARVEPSTSYSSRAYYGGGEVKVADGIIINVYKSSGANSSAVVKKVKEIYERLSSQENYSASVKLLDDQSQFISDSISNVLVSMLIGGALAVAIIFVFLKKVKTSIVIAITMPLSVLASLICLNLLGITLNMVSLGGLAVGIGMLVDNSIVVIEAISKHRDGGKVAYEAAVDGTCEVGGALFGSTLTTVCVFIPIMFAGGLTAEIFTDLAYAVIFSLTFSLIVAVTVIPALYCAFEGGNRLIKRKVESIEKESQLTIEMFSADTEFNQHAQVALLDDSANDTAKNDEKPKRKKLAFTKTWLMDKINELYKRVLSGALAYKFVTIAVAVVLFGASVGLLFITGTEFLPSIDKGQIEVRMDYGSTKQLEEVRDDVLSFTQSIAENVEGVDFVSVSVGKNGLLAFVNSGVVTVRLKSGADTKNAIRKIRELAKQNSPIGRVTVKEIDGVVASLLSGTTDMSVTIVGNDGEALEAIAEKIKNKLVEEGFTDVKDGATEKTKQYSLDFDREKIAALGLDYKTIVTTMRIGVASYTPCVVTIDGTSYDICVKFDSGAISSQNDFENFVVGFDSENRPVKLKDILKGGSVTEELSSACINRSNGKQMIVVSGVLPNADTGTATEKMRQVAQSVIDDNKGYSFSSSGISTYLNEAFEGLYAALIVSFFLLYAVMAIQFSSFIKPIIIMASIPFSFTGGFIALTITGTSLNVVSFIGIIMLMGIIVNNAIVMLEKIKQLKDEGESHYSAVQNACRERLRPILMTTLTTILALIPLAIGIGKGSELMQPLGIVVIGGLTLGTLVTLALVPAVYCAVYGLSKKFPDGKRK